MVERNMEDVLFGHDELEKAAKARAAFKDMVAQTGPKISGPRIGPFGNGGLGNHVQRRSIFGSNSDPKRTTS